MKMQECKTWSLASQTIPLYSPQAACSCFHLSKINKKRRAISKMGFSTLLFGSSKQAERDLTDNKTFQAVHFVVKTVWGLWSFTVEKTVR